MKYARFEDLPVWQAAVDLAMRIDRLIKHRAFRRPGDLADQLSRAALSVSNNIAEGFERGSTSELLMFLYIARGSAGEVRSMLRRCERDPEFGGTPNQATKPESEISNVSNFKSEISKIRSEISDLITVAESCSRQLRGWADSLQNSDIKGQRHLNDVSKAYWDQRRRANAFMQRVRTMLEEKRDQEGKSET